MAAMDHVSELTPHGTTARAVPDPLRDALLDSRQRWRDLVTMSADLAFETDTAGRFTFVSPDVVLGWPADALVGQPAELLLASEAVAPSRPNPFRPGRPTRRQTWLKRVDGGLACVMLASAPLLNAAGEVVGARGLGLDVTDQEGQGAPGTPASRHADVLAHILRQVRREVMTTRMTHVLVDEARRAMGAEGAAVMTLTENDLVGVALHHAGEGVEAALQTAAALLHVDRDVAAAGLSPSRQSVLACQTLTRTGERAGFALWRRAGDPAWEAEDRQLASSVTALLRFVLDHEAIQCEMGRQARTDALTGLPNRRAFLDEAARRIDRLDREEQPGTLMLVTLDGFKPLNDRYGHEIGDDVLVRVGALLRATFRPSDLVARMGGDEFAVWLDGSDELTAAERAEHLRRVGPQHFLFALPDSGLVPTTSISIACRQAGSGEELEDLIRRADHAMHEVKQNGRGHWLVSHPEEFLDGGRGD